MEKVHNHATDAAVFHPTIIFRSAVVGRALWFPILDGLHLRASKYAHANIVWQLLLQNLHTEATKKENRRYQQQQCGRKNKKKSVNFHDIVNRNISAMKKQRNYGFF